MKLPPMTCQEKRERHKQQIKKHWEQLKQNNPEKYKQQATIRDQIFQNRKNKEQEEFLKYLQEIETKNNFS